jgi:hypothetical protein
MSSRRHKWKNVAKTISTDVAVQQRGRQTAIPRFEPQLSAIGGGLPHSRRIQATPRYAEK